MSDLSPERYHEVVTNIINAIYPVLIPWEEQDVAIQERNYAIISSVAKNALDLFFELCARRDT